MSYTFDNLARLGEDPCGLSERNLQNGSFGTYTTTNYFMKDCNMGSAINFATKQPNIQYKGGFGNSGAGGCNIDYDSDLKIGTIQTNPKCLIHPENDTRSPLYSTINNKIRILT